MGELLVLPKRMEVSEPEKAEINKLIEHAIAAHKGNAAMINKLTFDSVTALAASEGRANELAEQGFFKRHWNNLTGKNQKIRAQIDEGIARSQYASQQMIQKLAEQNLLTFDLVTAVNNKLNTLVLESDEEFNQIYKMLGAFFKQTRADIVKHESRLDKLERNVELLHWNTTIEYQMYNGTEYSLLSDEEKMVCITNDFLHRTKGSWSTADLMVLKSTLDGIGLPIKQEISSQSFYACLVESPDLMERLFEGMNVDGFETIEPYEAPLIKGIEKIQKINGEEKYLVETVKEQLTFAGVAFDERDLKLSMVQQYLKNRAYMSPDCKVNLFDFVLELLWNLKIVNESQKVETADIIEFGQFENEILENKQEEKDRIYEVLLYTYSHDKSLLIKRLGDLLDMKTEEVKKLIAKLPATIVTHCKKEEAEQMLNEILSLGAYAGMKTMMETYHSVVAPKDGHLSLTNGNPHQLIFTLSNKRFVYVGDTVKPKSVVSTIYTMRPGLLFEGTDVVAGVNGEVVEMIGEHQQDVKKGDLIMVVKM
ncbi:hypothetical protein [Bacillus sp. B15-48]|uniref:hypothetical protein n=1 Tax=Bacillus sp. B15-48 TaxID=1548601 RepID=UPI00193FE55B|nr:hypothetical protein [Bacillus sp. B15-48]